MGGRWAIEKMELGFTKLWYHPGDGEKSTMFPLSGWRDSYERLAEFLNEQSDRRNQGVETYKDLLKRLKEHGITPDDL